MNKPHLTACIPHFTGQIEAAMNKEGIIKSTNPINRITTRNTLLKLNDDLIGNGQSSNQIGLVTVAILFPENSLAPQKCVAIRTKLDNRAALRGQLRTGNVYRAVHISGQNKTTATISQEKISKIKR